MRKKQYTPKKNNINKLNKYMKFDQLKQLENGNSKQRHSK